MLWGLDEWLVHTSLALSEILVQQTMLLPGLIFVLFLLRGKDLTSSVRFGRLLQNLVVFLRWYNDVMPAAFASANEEPATTDTYENGWLLPDVPGTTKPCSVVPPVVHRIGIQDGASTYFKKVSV